MIELQNVNKYYNRHKKNQIHVINNTSLSLNDKGLVALLGESGSGKTTLLNAIGGLNKISNGKIYVNGKKLPKRVSYRKDKLRTLNIGYIFQDYNLVEDMTVYDNIALSLKMIGIKNKEDIASRVNYVLDKVGMYRFRNRTVDSLSGGQRQRVGIARAIVKNPSVIIADEPTGNLDSKNTIEIMNIIKSISMDKLVILVTHEKNLAEFYASRIISLEDGKIIEDKKNIHNNKLDYRIDNNIYLKDFEKNVNLDNKDYSIDLYKDKSSKINVDIILQNGNIYIHSKDNTKIEVVDNNSNIEIINDKYKEITKEDYEKTKFNIKNLDNTNKKLKYTSVINIFNMLLVGFNKVRDYKLMKKILLVGFFISSAFIVYAFSTIFGTLKVNDNDFMDVHKNYVTIKSKQGDLAKYYSLLSDENIKFVIPGNSLVVFSFVNNDLMQFDNKEMTLEGSLASTDIISNEDVIFGTFPSSNNELVIDKIVFNNSQAEYTISNTKFIGISSYEDIIGKTVKTLKSEYKIVGIVDTKNPCIYVSNSEIDNVVFNQNIEGDQKYMEYTNMGESILKQGRLPQNDYEVVVNISNKEMMPLNKEISTTINNHKLTVVGYFDNRYDDQNNYVNHNTMEYAKLAKNKEFTVYPINKEEAINKYNAIDIYSNNKKEFMEEEKDIRNTSLVMSGVFMFISFIEIFLIIRSSFISRVKEVGVLRAIGIKRSDIYKMFLGEILVLTTITGIPGIIFSSAIIKALINAGDYVSSLFVLDKKVIILSITVIYLLNIIVGLLPVRKTIRKSPADILARTDVD